MKILVVGGGGREHAIVWKLSQSRKVDKLWCTPGNGGIAALAECLPYKATDLDGIVGFCKEARPDLVMVAPDDPLAMGLVDRLEAEGIRAFGPRANAAIIEASKSFAKGLMEKYKDVQVGGVTTVGEAIDWLSANEDVQAQRDRSFTLKTTVGKLMDMVGEDKVKTFLEEKAAAASYKADYENTQENIIDYWLHLAAFIFGFALLAMITLEFIDKDKR